jgi:hypothetical protein
VKKPSIPRVPKSDDPARQKFDDAVKQNIEVFTGARGGQITPLSGSATTAEVIAKINEIIDRMQ